MFGFGQLIEILKKDPKKIVFTEGEDPRILEAASRLLASNFLHPILVGDPEKISASAEKSGFNIRGAEIIDPMNLTVWMRWLNYSASFVRARVLHRSRLREFFHQQLLWNNACKDGYRRLASRRSYILNSRYSSSGITAYQDKAWQHNRIFMLYPCSSICNR